MKIRRRYWRIPHEYEELWRQCMLRGSPYAEQRIREELRYAWRETTEKEHGLAGVVWTEQIDGIDDMIGADL